MRVSPKHLRGLSNASLYAVRPDGTRKWEFATVSTVSASPAIDSESTIYLGSRDNKVYAINPDGGLIYDFSSYLATTV
jgi:outer membrane protein assembly factor BamB